jgi:hypothetical protein
MILRPAKRVAPIWMTAMMPLISDTLMTLYC